MTSFADNGIKVVQCIDLADGSDWEGTAVCYPQDDPMWDSWTNLETGEVLEHVEFEKRAEGHVDWKILNERAYDDACDVERDRLDAAYDRYIDNKIDEGK